MKPEKERATIAKDEVVVPVTREQARFDTRTIETGRVRITKTVSEDEIHVEGLLAREQCRVERVPVGRFIEQAVPVRYEGETMIVPVVEEVPVVITRLWLKEEVRIVRERSEERCTTPVVVRREDVSVERVGGTTDRGVERRPALEDIDHHATESVIRNKE